MTPEEDNIETTLPNALRTSTTLDRNGLHRLVSELAIIAMELDESFKTIQALPYGIG
jgi:hypothetical protein